jgi:multiple sugar transport system substrate-binding protein
MHPNVKFKAVEHLPFSGGPERMNVAIASRTMPDILEDTSQRSHGYAAKGVLVAMDDYFTAEELKDFKPGMWEAMRFLDGKHYGIPWATGASHMTLNVSLVKNAGATAFLPGPDGKITYDELEKLLQAVSVLKTEGIYPVALFAGDEQSDVATMALISNFGNGTRLFNEDRTKIILGNPDGVRGAAYLKSLIDKGLVMPGAESLKQGGVRELFYQQKMVLMINSHNGVVSTIDTAMAAGKFPKFEYMNLYYPSSRKGVPGLLPSGGVLNYLVFKSNPVQEKWAVEFAKFATNAENQKAISNFSMFPARVATGDLYPGNPYMTWAAEVAKHAYDVGSDSPAYAAVRAVFFPEMQALFTGRKTPQQAMNDFTARAQAEVDKRK